MVLTPFRIKPLRVRNPKQVFETVLEIPPALRQRVHKRRERVRFRRQPRKHTFRGLPIGGIAIDAPVFLSYPLPVEDEISIDSFRLQPDGPSPEVGDRELKAIIEAVVYVAEDPVSPAQLAASLEKPLPRIREVLKELEADYEQPERGLAFRPIAGGYKITTKPEHHEGVRQFVRNLKPPLKLSMAALETLAVIAYKQPITTPEVMEIRGVSGAGVLKTLLDKKLITTAGRKNVIGKPMMYRTTREFLIQFGLNSIDELPTLKEFEELKNLALSEAEEVEKVSGSAEDGAPRVTPVMEVVSGSEESPDEESTENPVESGQQ
jgi:segregation and condensation protein B